MYQQKFNDQNQETTLSQKTREAIIKYALEMKHLTLAQIEKKFFRGRQAHPEVTALIKDGCLRKKEDPLKFDTVLIPTAKAYDTVPASEALLPRPMSQIFAPRVNHDTKLTDLRIRFEELSFITKWTSERMLMLIPQIKELLMDEPDAICRKKEGDGYFLELEISQKTKAQYEYRIQKYREALDNEMIKAQKITGVIFICTDERVKEFIKALLPKGEKRISVLPYERYFRKGNGARDAQSLTANTKNQEAVRLRASGTSPSSLRGGAL